jgi:hypothetical protein
LIFSNDEKRRMSERKMRNKEEKGSSPIQRWKPVSNQRGHSKRISSKSEAGSLYPTKEVNPRGVDPM